MTKHKAWLRGVYQKEKSNCTVRYSTVQYSIVQYGTVQYGTVQYSTVWYTSVQYSAVVILKNSFQYSTVQCVIVPWTIPKVSGDKWYQVCNGTNGAKGVRG